MSKQDYPFTVEEYTRHYREKGFKISKNTVHNQIRRGLHDTIKRGAQIFMKDEPPRYSERGRKGILQTKNE